MDKKASSFKNFSEPCVSFKYKPIIQTFTIEGSAFPVTIKYSYPNNVAQFANNEINAALALEQCNESNYSKIKNLYLGTELGASENPVKKFLQLFYKEVVYPKDVNTGFIKTNKRTAYAENAPTEPTLVRNYWNAQQLAVTESLAIADYGHNGIDRNPLDRRTFWRSGARNRNRWGPIYSGSMLQFYYSGSEGTPLINSQGIRDGKTPSIFPFGVLLSHTQSAEGTEDATSGVMGSYENYDFGELAPMRGILGTTYPDGGSGFGDNAEYSITKDWNSIELGITTGGGVNLGSGSNAYWFAHPTCSALYTKQVYPDHRIFGRYHAPHAGDGFLVSEFYDDFNHRFRTPIFAGKEPWYDSYEEYSKDVKSIGKNYSIIPEFNISNNLEYYVKEQGGNFRRRNDKFLQNIGSNVTHSANSIETSGFNEEFFATYAHSDFMKYFETIVSDHDSPDLGINRIIMRCKGIKKLLPYNGFYPVNRTLQLATMFSQSYGAFLGGHKWENGKPVIANSENSGTLAMMAFLQPFFAPGIVYNTIKTGIAMDFPIYTGSISNNATYAGAALARLTDPPSYRIGFEAIVDLKNGSRIGGIPISASAGDKKIFWQGMEYLTNLQVTESGNRRPVYFDWNGGESSPLYKMAMHNFLAESINFFLKDSSLKTIVSKPIDRCKAMISGNTYYMDVKLQQSEDLLMYGGRWNNINKLLHSGTTAGAGGAVIVKPEFGLSYTGKYFGHPLVWRLEPGSTTVYGGGIEGHAGPTP